MVKEVTLTELLDRVDNYVGIHEPLASAIHEVCSIRGLSFAQNWFGHPYALMDAEWIGYYETLDQVVKALDIDNPAEYIIEADKEG